MNLSPIGLRAIFGAPLEGSKPVKYIYLDEAGTSAKEPVSIVLGVIVDADRQWRPASLRLNQLIHEMVPEELREGGFVSHAKTIWGNSDEGFRALWPMRERIEYLKAVMSLPRELGMPICIGLKWRHKPKLASKRLSWAQWDHITAFLYCIAQADRYMRDEAPIDEVATAIAEDVDSVKEQIRSIVKYIKENPFVIEKSENEKETFSPLSKEPYAQFAVNRIVDGIHFVKKSDAPLLQIADHCAFAFRRALSEQSYGLEFVESVLGKECYEFGIDSHPGGSSTFMWQPPKRAADSNYSANSDGIPFRLLPLSSSSKSRK